MQHRQDDFNPLSEINITPFVDVMLVLLVIFMITAPLLESGIPIELPKASAKALSKDETPVVLNITRERRLYLNDEGVVPSELISTLRRFYKSRSKREIFLRADEALPYGFVAQAMAAVKQAGVTKIGLVTTPPEPAVGGKR